MEEIQVKVGDLVTYTWAIIDKDIVYRYILDLAHGVALCEDKKGNRWRFSKRALIPATEEQQKTFFG